MSTFEKEEDTKKLSVSTFIKRKQKNIFSVSTFIDKYTSMMLFIGKEDKKGKIKLEKRTKRHEKQLEKRTKLAKSPLLCYNTCSETGEDSSIAHEAITLAYNLGGGKNAN